MIKAHVKDGECRLETTGNVPRICTEACRIMTSLYNALLEDDERAGEDFKNCMENAFREGIIFLKKDEEAEKVAEAAERKIQELKNVVSEKIGSEAGKMIADLLESLRRNSLKD